MSARDIQQILTELAIIRTKLENRDEAQARIESRQDRFEARMREHSTRLDTAATRLDTADAHNNAIAGLDPGSTTTRHPVVAPHHYRRSAVASIATASAGGGIGLGILVKWLLEVLGT